MNSQISNDLAAVTQSSQLKLNETSEKQSEGINLTPVTQSPGIGFSIKGSHVDNFMSLRSKSFDLQKEFQQLCVSDNSTKPDLSYSQHSLDQQTTSQNIVSHIGNLKMDLLNNKHQKETETISTSIVDLSRQLNNKSLIEAYCVMNQNNQRFYLKQPKFFQLKQNTYLHQEKTDQQRSDSQNQDYSQQASLTQQQIPLIKDWFSDLSVEEKMLSLTIVDREIVENIEKMVKTIQVKGQGHFKISQEISQSALGDKNSCDHQKLLSQEFNYTSINSIIEQQRTSISKESKSLPEKEFLDYVRLTTTTLLKEHPMKQNEQLSRELNTLTISPVMVEDTARFLNLVCSIVVFAGTPRHSALTYVEDLEQLNKFREIYISRDNQLINSSNLLNDSWTIIKAKSTIFDALINKVKDQINREQTQLILQTSDFYLFKTLLSNQSSFTFIQDICLTQLSKIGTDYFIIERIFLDIILRYTGQKSSIKVKTLKNQKKKSKRKLKKLEAKTQKWMMEEVHNLIDNILRGLDKQEEDKNFNPKDEKTEVNYWRTESERLDQLSDINLFQFLDFNHDMKEYSGTEMENNNMQPMSVFSESTEDIMENFSSELFKGLKSPQASTNTDIDLAMRKNLYSSEAGDSSIQLQKHYSDFNRKESGTKPNEKLFSSFKKNSLNSSDIQTLNNIDKSKQEETQYPSIHQVQPSSLSLPENNFHIIKPNLGFTHEQINFNKNKNKKKKKRTRGLGSKNTNEDTAKMNQFMRTINQYEDDEDYYEEDYVYQVKDQIQEQSKQKIIATLSKIGNKPMYVKKWQNVNAIEEEIKVQQLLNEKMPLNAFDRFSSHKNITDSHQQSSDSLLKKKSNNKSKKQGWEKSKKKSTRSKQSQLNKQNSYENQMLQPLSLAQQRQSSQYDQNYPQHDFMYDSTPADILKHILQQNVIEQSLKTQQTYQVQNIDQYIEDDENAEEQDSISDTEVFFDNVSNHMINFQKAIDSKLDSVRKERLEATKIIENLVSQSYHYYKKNYVTVKSYGSMASNLAIDSSDVDLAVVGLDFQGNKDLMINEMRKLFEQIELIVTSKRSLQFIETATVPVIKLEIDLVKISKLIERQEKKEYGFSYKKGNAIDENMRYLGIDITFEDSFNKSYRLDGIPSMSFNQDCSLYIKELCMKQPHLKPIVLVLKKLLQNHNLNQTYSGGLNSYSLVLMTSAYLTLFPNICCISKNLLEIFHYYGEFFDPKTTIITVTHEKTFVKALAPLEEHMTIIDPLNSMNNTSRGAFRIQQILEIFRQAYHFLYQSLTQYKLDIQEVDVIQLLLNTQNVNVQQSSSE